ncbi:MAG: hypothetical protein JW850_09815, partial [Thermoflexales bacterium]|nr:hypothetical protein [Thermoflexales bacterium]
HGYPLIWCVYSYTKDTWLYDFTQDLVYHHSVNVGEMGIKRQVQVGAHVSAQVVQDSQGKLLKFSKHSVFAGKVLALLGRDYADRACRQSLNLMSFFNKLHLIAQPLR